MRDDEDEDDEPLFYVTWGSPRHIIEDDRRRYDAADWGVDMKSGNMGFLAPHSEVETLPDKDEEEDEDTRGKPGMGAIVSGMKLEREKELYQDLVKEYGYRDYFIYGGIAALFVGAAFASATLAPILTTLAIVLTVVYVLPR